MHSSQKNTFNQRIVTINERLRSLDSERASLPARLAELNTNCTQSVVPTVSLSSTVISSAEKLALFRRLFRGREDVYAVRWENAKLGRGGYKPACRSQNVSLAAVWGGHTTSSCPAWLLRYGC